MTGFNHLIEIDAEKREIAVYRAEADGTKVFYTSTALPEVDMSTEEGIETFKKFAQQLGENILLDSAVIQKLYGF